MEGCETGIKEGGMETWARIGPRVSHRKISGSAHPGSAIWNNSYSRMQASLLPNQLAAHQSGKLLRHRMLDTSPAAPPSERIQRSPRQSHTRPVWKRLGGPSTPAPIEQRKQSWCSLPLSSLHYQSQWCVAHAAEVVTRRCTVDVSRLGSYIVQ